MRPSMRRLNSPPATIATLARFSYSFAAAFLVLIAGMVNADTLNIDCKAVQAPYTTSNVTLMLGDSVTLAVWEGTSFYIDCFSFAIRSSACDGRANGGLSATVKASIRSESAVAAPSSSSVVQLSKDLFGTSMLSTAYYYAERRRIYLVLDLLSIPPGCADGVSVLYTFSAYTSTSWPPLYPGGGWASPSLIGANDPLIIAQYNATLVFQLPTRTADQGGAVTTPPPTHQFGLLSVPSRARSCGELNRVSGVTTYVSNSRLGPLLRWNISDVFSGVYLVCLRPNATTPFLYFGVITIFPTNPAYFHVDEFSIGRPIQLRQPYILTFVGKHLDLRRGKDSAKLASLISFSCATANPAGGVPPATALQPLNVRDSPEAYWNITLTIPGAFVVCYQHASQWAAVPYYEPLGVDSRSLVPNTQGAISVGPVRFATNTVSRSVPVSTDSPTDPPSPTNSGTTTTAAPTSTAPPSQSPPPSSTTSSPSSSSDSGGNCVLLPQQCALLDDTANTLRLVLSLAYTATAFPSVAWSRNLSNMLCVPLKSISIYELSNNVSNPGYSSLVLGINCEGNLVACNAAESLSALHCLVNGGGAAANDSFANETYADWRTLLRSPPLNVVASRATSSSISTANTTDHAASSENPLTPAEVALVSSAIPLAVGIAGGVFSLLVLYRKRKFVRKQLGRLRPGEVFRQMFSRPVGQSADADMMMVETYASGPPEVRTLDVPLLNSLKLRSDATCAKGNVWGVAVGAAGQCTTSVGGNTPEHDGDLLFDVLRMNDSEHLAAPLPPPDPLRAVLAGSRGRSSKPGADGPSVHEVL